MCTLRIASDSESDADEDDNNSEAKDDGDTASTGPPVDDIRKWNVSSEIGNNNTTTKADEVPGKLCINC